MKQISLTQGRVAMVDDCDYEELNQYKWCAVKHGHRFYASRSIYLGRPNGKLKTKSVFMHRIIVNPNSKMVIDHIDGNGLNNQRTNLRAVPCRLNLMAFRTIKEGRTSIYRGVSKSKDMKRWKCTICWSENGKLVQKYYASFNTEKEAALAFNRAAIRMGYQIEALNKIAS